MALKSALVAAVARQNRSRGTFTTEFAKDGRNTYGIQTAELDAAYLNIASRSFS